MSAGTSRTRMVPSPKSSQAKPNRSSRGRFSSSSAASSRPSSAATLEEFAENLRSGRNLNEKRENLLHTMACKAAIKGGWKSDPAELKVLVEKVQSGAVRYCPHGRPVAVKLTRYELEKMFKRA